MSKRGSRLMWVTVPIQVQHYRTQTRLNEKILWTMKPLTALSNEDEVKEHLCLPPEVNPHQPNPLTTEQQVREEQEKEVFMFCLFLSTGNCQRASHTKFHALL